MITKKDVEHVASLARIHLKEKEVDCLTKDLEKILAHIHQLNALDVTDTQPTSHVLPLKNVYRKDKVLPSLGQKEVLKFAVEQKNGFFKVPKVIE